MSDMEEGELSDQEVVAFPPNDDRNVDGLFGHNKKDFQAAFNRDLPDLIQSVDNGIDRTATEKMQARAKRFNIQSAGNSVKYDDIIEMYQGLGIPSEEYDGSLEKSLRKHRLESIHVRGFDKMTAEDIYDYFKDFNPVSFEWVDAQSANVIWAMSSSSAKALFTLSQPLLNREDEAMEVNERVVNEDGEEEKLEIQKLTKEQLMEKFENREPIFKDEIMDEVPEGPWRIGKPSEKAEKTIFMRIAKVIDLAEDPARDRDLFQKNRQLRMEGGVISASRKRKIQEALLYERQVFEEAEKQKKYQGPVGKNPWGSIAQEWSSAPKKRDFAEELKLFAKQRGVGIRTADVGGDVRQKLIEARSKDWDAPEQQDIDPIAASLHKRSRRGQSPLGVPVEEDDEEEWNKKLKRPRMSMVADEVQTKASAKQRLFASMKRKVTNKPSQIEVFEEEDDNESVEEENGYGPRDRNLDLRMTINTGQSESRNIRESEKRLSKELFSGSGKIRSSGVSSSIRARLGRKQSVDSLEQDTGEDLRAELDGRHAANMVIQVTQSDDDNMMKDGEEEEDDEEEVEEERTVRRAVPSSVVKRPIKVEKGLESSKGKGSKSRAPLVDSKKDVREKIRERERHAREIREQERQDERRREERMERRKKEMEVERERQRKERELSKSKPATGSKSSKSRHPASSSIGRSRIKIKKEKVTDDEDESSDSSSDDDSSSSSSSSSSDSSSGGSSSDSSDSSSSSSSSDSDRDRRKKKVVKKRQASSSTKTSSTKRDAKKEDSRSGRDRGARRDDGGKKSSKDSRGLKDKLSEYLKQAKEKKKKDGKK